MIALIAGRGALPAELIARLPERPMVCAMSGSEPDQVEADVTFRLEQLGSFLEELKSKGITQVCMAGAVTRPQIDPSAIDGATLPLVPVLQAAIAAGDDGALRAVIGILEQGGFEVKAAHEIAPDLLMPEGVPTKVKPGEIDKADAERAAVIAFGLSAADIGQACAVRSGQAIAIETLFGTDWMLESLAQRPDGQGGLFYKAPKAGQDRRADLPTIGPATVAGAARAGLNGIVLEAEGVIVLDREEVVAACDRHGLFLWLREA
ncbi:UDP-2,3-diacylglucosamine diphosphatase LpxI [Tritonibacter mobilis]|nr:UDP-2,3-diacylglucosamine diphosphatase LpxI [Tritonibacter mobilis]